MGGFPALFALLGDGASRIQHSQRGRFTIAPLPSRFKHCSSNSMLFCGDWYTSILCPMYYHLKFAFLVWLQLPSVDGAKQLYTNHLRPFFLKHQTRVDRFLGLTYGELHKLISAHQAEIEYARAVVMKILGSDISEAVWLEDL
ncbi:HVA22-like protein K [Prunus dulcis]|uniref:HVA22-like protein n=1 Tax=Prunus dulcis TaxID=3755 RepID=A0A4Y1RU47_PRUDU|nr:HVA22-like protein K [Prunus dulcis]